MEVNGTGSATCPMASLGIGNDVPQILIQSSQHWLSYSISRNTVT